MKRQIRLAITALVLVICLVARTRADVLEQVPEDALVVVKVSNLQSLSNKLSKFAEDIGLAQAAPQFSNPLNALQEHAGIKEGLNKEGDLAFVALDPKTNPENQDEAMLFLIPVTDYKAFLGNFQDAKTEGEVSEVTLPNTPQPSYIAHWGNYAVLAPSKAVVSLKHGGIKPQGAVAKELSSKDIVVFGNMPKVKERVLPLIQEHKDEMLQKVEAGLQQSGAGANGAMAKNMFGMLIDALSAMVRDSRGASFALNFTPEGISTTMLGDFNDGTKAAEVVSGFKNSSEPLLEGLPAEKYLFFGGFVNDPANAQKISTSLIDPIAAELKKSAGDEAQAVNDYIESTKKIISLYTGGAIGVVAPTGALGQDALIQTVSVLHGDSKQLIAAYKQALSAQTKMVGAMGQQAVKMNVDVKESAKTVGGVNFDQITMKFDADPNDPQAQQAQQGINMMYGPNGMQTLIGAIDDKTTLIAMGLPEAQLTNAIEAAKKNDTTIASTDALKGVAANLPKNRVMVGYIAVDQIVTTGLNYARQFGFGVPLQLPPDLPPIGIAVATEGSTVRVDTYTPMSLIQSLVAAGMQMKMQMQGGGAPPAAVP
jgi:hypothetical protein